MNQTLQQMIISVNNNNNNINKTCVVFEDDSDGEKIINSLSKQSWDVEYIQENGKVKITKIGRDEKRRSNL